LVQTEKEAEQLELVVRIAWCADKDKTGAMGKARFDISLFGTNRRISRSTALENSHG